MSYIPQENDLVRSYAEHAGADSYVDGIAVAVDEGFVTLLVLRRTRNGSAAEVLENEFVCAPLNGRSMFDDPFRPRLEKLGHSPTFYLTFEQAAALARFRYVHSAIERNAA